jgi:hypothetical protein
MRHTDPKTNHHFTKINTQQVFVRHTNLVTIHDLCIAWVLLLSRNYEET